MSLSTTIYKLRTDANMSQEKFASLLNVSRQAVQKWETGTALPDLANLIAISKRFNVSLDTLVFDSDTRIVEELTYDKKLQPEFSSIHNWELYSSQLLIEYRQSIEEGLDIEKYKDLFAAIDKMPVDENKDKMADVLFNIVLNAPTASGYEYNEPSALAEIKAMRKEYAFEKKTIDCEALKSKIRGAWLGRISGCLLGKPIEGIRTDELVPFLMESGNYPMHRYISKNDINDEVCDKYKFRFAGRCYADAIECAPADDDTNYTVVSQLIIDKYSRDFTPYDVSRAWLSYQPKDAYCTAERVAFCNFVRGYTPPASAQYKNPYREWIGAQIRGDYFGYINPGNPELAAEMAWRDASISHIKNGIYGEMFIAAMIACAAVTDSVEDIILGGLAQIPYTSRLYVSVMKLLENYKNGMSQKDCFAAIHKEYDEHNQHDWCHTISNALIVAAALLYGGGDFGKSICMAVETGFDTDCNGATVGSILGMRNGAEYIGSEWTAPLNGMLDTAIFGMGRVSIDELCDHTMEHVVM